MSRYQTVRSKDRFHLIQILGFALNKIKTRQIKWKRSCDGKKRIFLIKKLVKSKLENYL